jgi:tetratricopeptide (TPR) repeat protein
VQRALRIDRAAVRAWILLGRSRPSAAARRPRSRPGSACRDRPQERRARVPADRVGLRALDRSREFETYLRELLAERGDDAHARLALARALAARGEVDEALAELRRVLEREPEPPRRARGTRAPAALRAPRPEATKEYAELLDVLERRGLLRAQERLG